MLACRLVILGNLGIGEAYSVLAITTRAALDHGSNDLNDRQDFASRRVRLGSAFNLGDPLVQRPGPEPAKCRRSRYPRITHQSMPREHIATTARQCGRRRF